jgi:hypothetical protein
VLARTVSTVELVLENGLGVLLGLLGGVGVVDVGLVAAGDLSVSRHDDSEVGRVVGSRCWVLLLSVIGD